MHVLRASSTRASSFRVVKVDVLSSGHHFQRTSLHLCEIEQNERTYRHEVPDGVERDARAMETAFRQKVRSPTPTFVLTVSSFKTPLTVFLQCVFIGLSHTLGRCRGTNCSTRNTHHTSIRRSSTLCSQQTFVSSRPTASCISTVLGTLARAVDLLKNSGAPAQNKR